LAITRRIAARSSFGWLLIRQCPLPNFGSRFVHCLRAICPLGIIAIPILWPHKFVKEGLSVGRILTGYINLEVGLMHCVQVGLGGDFDIVVKKMFKQRGEKRRIDEAEKLGAPAYAKIKLETEFQKAIRDMRHCLKIRNQYAHWVWWDDYSGKLAFAKLEDLARRKRKVPNLDKLNLINAPRRSRQFRRERADFALRQLTPPLRLRQDFVRSRDPAVSVIRADRLAKQSIALGLLKVETEASNMLVSDIRRGT
jgi:hypothetical protein